MRWITSILGKVKNEWSYSSSPVSFMACTGTICLCVYIVRCPAKLIFCACERKNSLHIKNKFNFIYFLKVDTSLLYNVYQVFPGCKERPERATDHSPPSSAAVMEE